MRYKAKNLIKRRTLSTSQCDDLKIDTGRKRVWISRCGTADGEPCENKITVERLIKGRWTTVEVYCGGRG